MTNLLNWIAPGVSTILFYDFTPAGLPVLRLPQFLLEDLPSLLGSAAVVALVLFSSGMLTARSFAAKGNYEIDADREFAAFGAENTASARSQGFAVTGADLRTAVAIASGGRTQVTGLVAAATILRQNWALDRIEVGLSVVTTLGVVAFGVINAILVAVILALLRFVKQTARPRGEILAVVDGFPGFHSIDRHDRARITPGIMFYRFDSQVTFFNSEAPEHLVARNGGEKSHRARRAARRGAT